MSTDHTYNGWTNRETWNTNLWMTNDEALLADAQEIAARHIIPADEDEGTPREVDTYSIAQDLREWWDETFAPEGSGPLSDAWNATMSEVNWDEIAEGLAEE